MSIPSIACIGIIGQHNNPLHIAIFPPYDTKSQALLEFSFLLNGSLDTFDERCQDKSLIDQDLGRLQVVDERLSIWGWQTATNTRLAIIIDSWGKEGRPMVGRRSTGDEEDGRIGQGKPVGLQDLKPAFKALQIAYIKLLQNPFYTPDEHDPALVMQGRRDSCQIKSKGFINEVQRIGSIWKPGVNLL